MKCSKDLFEMTLKKVQQSQAIFHQYKNDQQHHKYDYLNLEFCPLANGRFRQELTKLCRGDERDQRINLQIAQCMYYVLEIVMNELQRFMYASRLFRKYLLYLLEIKPFVLEFQNSRCLFTEFANLIHFGRKKCFCRKTDGWTERQRRSNSSLDYS